MFGNSVMIGLSHPWSSPSLSHPSEHSSQTPIVRRLDQKLPLEQGDPAIYRQKEKDPPTKMGTGAATW